MKTLFIIAFFSLSLCSVQAQYNGNYLSNTDFYAIKIHGVPISKLVKPATNVTIDLLKQLFGNPTSVKNNPDAFSSTLYYGSNYVHVSTGNPKNRVSRLEINDTNWSVTIKGTTFKLGDPLSKLQQVFGSDFKSTSKNGEVFTSFTDEKYSWDSLDFDFDPVSKKITRIIYYVIP